MNSQHPRRNHLLGNVTFWCLKVLDVLSRFRPVRFSNSNGENLKGSGPTRPHLILLLNVQLGQACNTSNGTGYSYTQPSESEDYGLRDSADSGYSLTEAEFEADILLDQAEIEASRVQYPPQPEVEFVVLAAEEDDMLDYGICGRCGARRNHADDLKLGEEEEYL
ncbi:hypothetical protein Bca52824_052393 [Brassica carinata]|uniref:Uncharacterized protein n=1 Tax=Brassica carinata TaxID=52824 RepID=A0A8X7R4M4_BRACI|nr:hypothetical protein Bca52824_052393 [Brassica carinata]